MTSQLSGWDKVQKKRKEAAEQESCWRKFRHRVHISEYEHLRLNRLLRMRLRVPVLRKTRPMKLNLWKQERIKSVKVQRKERRRKETSGQRLRWRILPTIWDSGVN